MFTGIIQSIGTITGHRPVQGDLRLGVKCADLLSKDNISIGDSIAVNGVCLTAVQITDSGFIADVSAETLACTLLADISMGRRVNLELALQPTTRLGGHLVSGHVDGVGTVQDRWVDARSSGLRFSVATDLSRFIAAKGSICIDGVSLTVNTVDTWSATASDCQFEVNIVPHTLSATIMADYRTGTQVHVEVDLVARYLARLQECESPVESVNVSRQVLINNGFLSREGNK